MKVLVLYAHPWEKSFNHAILQKVKEVLAANNHEMDVLDLNQEKFDPILCREDLALYSQGKSSDPKVTVYQEKLLWAEHLVLIFPVWWTGEPAVLKGFFDKVLLKGFAFDKKGKIPKGLLGHIRGASVFNTMSSPGFYYALFLKNAVKQSVVKGTLKFCGIKKVKWYPLFRIDKLSKERAQKYLSRVSKAMSKI